jgi:hypothetical protein
MERSPQTAPQGPRAPHDPPNIGGECAAPYAAAASISDLSREIPFLAAVEKAHPGFQGDVATVVSMRLVMWARSGVLARPHSFSGGVEEAA